MRQLLTFLFLCEICATKNIYSTPKWQCDGGIEFDKAPIIFYFNSTETLCFAARKGCTPASVTRIHTTMEECLIKEFPEGRLKSKTFMCGNAFYGNALLTFEIGKSKTKSPYLLAGCPMRERFCPSGYSCFQDIGFSTCCAIDNSVQGEKFIKTKYSKSMV